MTLRGIPCKLSQTVQGNTTVERFFKNIFYQNTSQTPGVPVGMLQVIWGRASPSSRMPNGISLLTRLPTSSKDVG